MPERLRFDDVEEGDELSARSFFLSKDQVRAYARAGGTKRLQVSKSAFGLPPALISLISTWHGYTRLRESRTKLGVFYSSF